MAAAIAPSAASIGWDRPWLAHLSGLRPVLESADMRGELTLAARTRGVFSGQGAALTFAAADDAGGNAYELHIARTGRVPTRPNLHDLFNAATWLAFPRLKAALNARQAQCLTAGATEAGRCGRRGGQRDAATLFDESGLIVAVAARVARECDLRARIAAHDWPYLFLAQRARWQRDWIPCLFGHAVMEKLVRPYPAITVRVAVVVVEQGDPQDTTAVDAAAAAAFVHDAAWSPEATPPLPVLGIPGWWPANESPAFYDDTSVFRPLRPAFCA